MASAVAAKPVLNPVKAKRPPAPLANTSVKPTNPTSSPSIASKRLPGQKGPPPTPTSAPNGTASNAVRPNKPRKDQPRNAEQSRLNRPSLRGGLSDMAHDRKAMRKVSGPLVTKEEHILKKFKGQPPSLIIHLHPTYFRFDQQDGSFSYQSEMKFIIEHLQKRTVPHDILEELKKSDVRFYDGWLIVRVVDHKSVVPSSGNSAQSSPDDQTPFSIHNYTPYITPSSWAPYPSKEQSKSTSPQGKSQQPKQDPEASAKQPNVKSDDTNQAQNRSSSKPSEPKIYHVALRPTALSQHQDIVIDALTPDPKSVGKTKTQMSGRTSAPTSGAPPTPLSAVPSTPIERGHPAKRQKMKIEPRDLLDYEARVVNATAPPLWLEPVNSVDEADRLLEFMKDPFHDEDPPSPRGRKRTIAELAADEAIAKEEERFMLIMDERLAPGAGGAAGASATVTDGQAGVPLFQPRFEKFNALENIKAQHKENKRIEQEKKVQQDQLRRAQQEALEEKRRQQHHDMEQERDRNVRARQLLAAREQLARQQGAQQPHVIPQVNGAMPAMQHPQQVSQAQRSSPVVHAMSPHANSSPVVGNMSAPAHSVPMNVTSSNQGGSPARPGSAMQHAHPGVQMVRNASHQGMSRQGTPQMAQSTPSIRQATPVMRTATPSQRMNASSPHGSMMAPTPQMAHTGMMATPQMAAVQATAQQAMLQQRQQQLIQHQQQMQAQGHQMNNAELAQVQAHNHAMQQQRFAQQQHLMQQAVAAQQHGQHQSPVPHPGQFATQQQQQAYQAQVAQMMKQQMAAHAQGQAQGQGSPQHHGIQMAGGQPQRPTTSGGQGGPNNSLIHQRFMHHRNNFLRQVAQNYGGQPNNIPQQQVDMINNRAQVQARRDVEIMMQRRNMQVQQAQMGMQGMPQPQGAQQQQQMMMTPQLQAQIMAQMQAQQMGKQG